jgi:hypothetical protein
LKNLYSHDVLLQIKEMIAEVDSGDGKGGIKYKDFELVMNP